MSELSRDIQAVAGDVATLRTEIERFRAELRTVFERFLDEHRSLTSQVRQDVPAPTLPAPRMD